MLGIGSSNTLKRDELYDKLFQSIEREFHVSVKSLDQQLEDFFSKTTIMTVVVTYLMNRNREEMFKDLTPELRNYILGIMEEGEKKAKQDVQALEKREGDGQGSMIRDI